MELIIRALTGEGAHAESRSVFEGIDWKAAGARPGNSPHSVFQLLNHIVFWQDWVIDWLDGRKPPTVRHGSLSWPGGVEPANKREWEAAKKRFVRGLEALEKRAARPGLQVKRGKKSGEQMLQAIASHNSYHLGQAVLLRQMLDLWPPPSGGMTW